MHVFRSSKSPGRGLGGAWQATGARLQRPEGLRSPAFMLLDCNSQFSQGATLGHMPKTNISEKVFVFGYVAH